MLVKKVIVAVLVALGATVAAHGKSVMRPGDLRCEHVENPAVIDAMHPLLSWINTVKKPTARGYSQSAYQIVVASSKDKLLKCRYDVWDSKKVYSDRSAGVEYEGIALRSDTEYWWRVRTWDHKGKVSEWSEPARWTTGLLYSSDRKAKWIGAPWAGEEARKFIPASERAPESDGAPYFRKSFTLKSKPVWARAYLTAGGYVELYANGERVGDDCLSPNFTAYTNRPHIGEANIVLPNMFTDYRVMYMAYDVTSMLSEGANALGAILGHGFYDSMSYWVCPFGSPRFMCQVEVKYADGTSESIVTDDSWLASPSPIVMNGVFDGEIYDANREQSGWARADFASDGWVRAAIRETPLGTLTAHTAPTDKVVERFAPTSLSKVGPKEWDVEFPVEISGWIRLNDIAGAKGDTLNVSYVCESPLGVHKYVFNGSGRESYAPRFTWYVFRKARISGVENLTPDNLVAEAVNTAVGVSARFETSSHLVNAIHNAWVRTQLDNMHGGVASDCPHRERSPYTGDGQVAMNTVLHNFDASAFYEKWIRDMRDAQNPESGYLPNGAPWQPGCGGGVAWGAAMNIMPWNYYVHYGDRRMLVSSFNAMKAQVDYMTRWITPDGTMLHRRTNHGSHEPNYWLNLGEWVGATGLPADELVHTYYMWKCADNTAKAAAALGQSVDKAHYESLARSVKNAFHKKFYDPATHSYGDFGSNLFALDMGVPAENVESVREALRSELVDRNNSHLNTGIFGTQLLFETLAANGMNHLAYTIFTQPDFPGFANWLTQGATVFWENWNGNDSHNHPMFGGGLTWLYRDLAGVRADELSPGYKRFTVRPILDPRLPRVMYSTMTAQGKVEVAVDLQADDALSLTVEVPCGSEAVVYVPKMAASLLTESGRKVKADKYEVESTLYGDCYKLTVPQGRYLFVSR